jgi:MSHA pilin protein MshA
MKSRTQAGFTMIELIVVIVILGVLAATALPKFIDMRANAEQAALDGIAGGAASAMNLNFSGCALMNNVVTANKCVKITACDNPNVASILQGGLDTTKYTVAVNAAGVDIGTTNGNAAMCKVTRTVGSTTYTSTFTGIAAGN